LGLDRAVAGDAYDDGVVTAGADERQ